MTTIKEVSKINQTSILIKQINRGNKQAFSDLIHPLIPNAYRTAYGILRTQSCAEDAVQKSMIEAYTNIMAGKKFKNFPAWFNHLAACRALDLIRQRAKSQTITSNVDPSDVAHHETAVDYVLSVEQSEEIIDAVMSLENDSYRTSIILYYYEEMSISEIAKLLDVKEATIKTHLRRARHALAEKLSYKKELGVI